MAEENKEAKVENVVESKKLDDHKETEENKKAIAEAEGKAVPEIEEKPKEPKADVKKESKAELEREYIVPMRRYSLSVPRYKRAKRAVRTLKEFLARHMKVEDRDLNKVKIDINLNNEIWFRGIKKPANKIKVKVVKRDGIVYAELAEVPEVVQYKIAREIKRASNVKKSEKPKAAPKEEKVDADKDGVADKVEKSEDAKSNAEVSAKIEKAEAKNMKHTTKAGHEKKTMPVQKKLKK